MRAVPGPAIKCFAVRIDPEFLLAQVLITRTEGGFELRHVGDRDLAADQLRSVPVMESRGVAQGTAAGAFRPLKSAPNLQRGWILQAAGLVELETALHQLYPGAIPDWFAVQSGTVPVTHFRDFTDRQTGMFRVAQKLTDLQAARVIRACCHVDFCLKQRLWTVPGLDPDQSSAKSAIPCLEPCALLLEMARKGMRIEQEEKVAVELAPSDLESVRAALEAALTVRDPDLREGDTSAAGNPRRLRLALEKLAGLPPVNEPETHS